MPDAHQPRGNHAERSRQRGGMVAQDLGDDVGLHGDRQAGEPEEHDPGMHPAEAKHQFAEVLVRRHQQGATVIGLLEGFIIR